MKSIIIGLDTGLNSGLAILSIKGEILLLNTFRGHNKSIIIREILKVGRPILIATDRKDTPKAVKELASSFGCRIFRPKRDLSREEKEEIIKNYKEIVKDDHQLDSLASALFAFRKIKRKIEVIEKYLKEKNLADYIDETIYQLFRSRGINLEQIIRRLLADEEKKEREDKLEKIGREDTLIEFLKERIELERELKKLREELRFYKKLKLRFDEVIWYKNNFDKLNKYFEILKDLEKVTRFDLLPVLPLEKIENLEEVNNFIGLEGRIIFSNDDENFLLLNKYKIKCLLTESQKEYNTEYPILKIDKKEFKVFGNVYGIEKRKFELMMRDFIREGLKKWVEEERRRI